MKKYIIGLCSLFLLANVTLAAEQHTLVIQPGPDEGKDTYFGTNSVGGRDGRPDAHELRIGGWGDYWTSYIEFDLSQIPEEAEINTAVLSMFNSRLDTNENYGKLFRVTEFWNEPDPKEDSFPDSVDFGMGYQFVENNNWWVVDVTNLTKGWVDEDYPNYGFKILGLYNSNYHGKGFYSSDYLDDPSLRPKLTITYTLPEVEKSVSELNGQLLTQVEEGVDSRPIKNSYLAHLKKLLQFYEESQINAAVNQLGAFLRKLSADGEQGDVAPETQLELEETANELLEKIQTVPEDTVGAPLMTQIASPYPPESAEWADDVYANGVDPECQTIADCGCAVASMTMLSQYRNISEGYDGENIDPGSLNAWLSENNGYSAGGSIIWERALQYFSPTLGYSQFTFDHHNAQSKNLINQYVNRGDLAIGRNEAQGHYFLLTGTLSGDNYTINDPYWYNTKTTSDETDEANFVWGYGGVVNKANLFSYHYEPQPLPQWVWIGLASPAELVLTDSQGRKVGHDPRTGETFDEIPGASYSYERIANQASANTEEHFEKIIAIQNPEDDLFSLEVIGTGTGDYDLTISTNGGLDNHEWEHVADQTEEGKVDSFIIDVPEDDSSSRAVSRLREIAAAKELAQPEVAEHLREVADTLELKNHARSTVSVPLSNY